MNILVTGGAGYIGSHTCVELVAAGHRPVIIDNLSNSSKKVLDRLAELTGSNIAFYEQDFQDADALRKVIAKEKIEGIIHFAAFKAVGESVENPLKYYLNNTAGFAQLLEVVAEADSPVHTVIFSSTAAVYGNPAEDSVTEESPPKPESPYGWSKLMDEVILRDTCTANPRLSGIALRYFNVVGAHESGRIGEHSVKPQNLMPIIVQAAAGISPPLTVLGDDYPTADGTCLRDYIHVVDLAKAHVAALENASAHAKTRFKVYNVGTGKPTSVLELIKTFEKVNGIEVPYKIGARRPGDPVAYYAIAAKAEKELGWKATKSVEDSCADAWRWQSQNPNGYR